MVITGIRYIRDNGAQITIDDDLCFVIDDTQISGLSLSKGMTVSDDLRTQLEKEHLLHYAKVKALASLSRGDFSRKGLIRRLCEKGADRDAAMEIAEKMQEAGFINDSEYAGRICRVYSCERHFGIRRVMTELYKRGINTDTAQQAIDEFAIPDAENVFLYYEAKFKNMGISDMKTRKKAADTLARAGYGWGDVNLCLRDFLTT